MERRSFEGTSLLAISLVAVFGAIACGTLISVPQLRDADNDEIVNLGDSIFALSGEIFDDLRAKAGETWRHYAISGTQMIGGVMGPSIPTQYETARADNANIRVVYMNGGGNDILLPALAGDPYGCRRCNYWWCDGISAGCKALIEDIAVTMEDLIAQMHDDGVEQIVLLGYYHLSRGLFGDLTTLNKVIDYTAQLIADRIADSDVSVVYVGSRDAFAGHEAKYIMADGIHPTSAGSAVLADLLWKAIDS